jgi:hypothetical protein
MCGKRENQGYERASPRDECEDVGRKDEGRCAARKERRDEMGRMDSRKLGMTKGRGMHADKSVLKKQQRRTEIIIHLRGSLLNVAQRAHGDPTVCIFV